MIFAVFDVSLVGRLNSMLCTNFELTTFTGFGDCSGGYAKFSRVSRDLCHVLFQTYYTSYLWEGTIRNNVA